VGCLPRLDKSVIHLVQKVIERLSYENLLMSHGIEARKRVITLKDILIAGKIEPRIMQVLPAILLYKPHILRGIEKDLKKNTAINENIDNIFNRKGSDDEFMGIDVNDCRRSAIAFHGYLESIRKKNRNKLFNLRLSSEDISQLEKVSQGLGIDNYSEVIRQLIHKSAESLASSSQLG
jgi:predicted DNA binding CopG/RHH family protein